jgi:plasmid stabilization system protein ParE
MKYKVTTTSVADRDLDSLFDYLYGTHLRFGHNRTRAFALAAKRLETVKRDLRSLGNAPHQGTLRPHLMAGLRNVTKDRAIFYFLVDEDARELRVLAVFFGGQEHQRAMLKRLLSEE